MVIFLDEFFVVNNVFGVKVVVEMGVVVGVGDFVLFYVFLGEVGEVEFEDVEGFEWGEEEGGGDGDFGVVLV